MIFLYIWMRDDQSFYNSFYRGLIAIHLLSTPGCWDSQSARTWACWGTTPVDRSLYMAVWTGFSVDVPTWLKFNHIESYMLFHVIHIICVYIYILYIYIHGIYIYTYIYIYLHIEISYMSCTSCIFRCILFVHWNDSINPSQDLTVTIVQGPEGCHHEAIKITDPLHLDGTSRCLLELVPCIVQVYTVYTSSLKLWKYR